MAVHCSCIGGSSDTIMKSRLFRTALSELLGTFLLVSLGLSAAATAAVTAPATAQSGSALALIVALYVTMGASGGHINPAVSTALFAVRRMRLVDYLVYQAAQYAGGVLAAGLVCCFLYPPLLDSAGSGGPSDQQGAGSNGTAEEAAAAAASVMEAIYVTHAHDSLPVWRALTSEIYATGAFILAVRGITDRRNAGPPLWLQPPMLAAAVLALTQCTAPLSGCALNPARDLPPRMVVAAFQLATDGAVAEGLFGDWGFLAPLLGPYAGAAVGSWLYELCIARGLAAAAATAAATDGADNDDDVEAAADGDDGSDAEEDSPTPADATGGGGGGGGVIGGRPSRRRRRRMRMEDEDLLTSLSLLGSVSAGKSRDVSVSVSNA